MRIDDELKWRGWFELANMMVHANEGSGIDSVYPTGDEVKMVANPFELSGSKKMKYELTHRLSQSWCIACVRGKAKSGLHKRNERNIEANVN